MVLVKEIAMDFRTDLRFDPDIFDILQDAAEKHLVNAFRVNDY